MAQPRPRRGAQGGRDGTPSAVSARSGALGRGEVSNDVAALLGRPRAKYGSSFIEVDGIKFRSKREAAVWQRRVLTERAGAMRNLRRQVSFVLHAAGGNVVGRYVADHVYEEPAGDGWREVVEDVKGFPTPLYDWKRRHMKAEYGIVIREVK
jgi:hypothetical protein